jgi:opacity protein-like surface antigen
MKKINSFIKTTIAMSFCLGVSMTASSQKNKINLNGWSISFHAGAAANSSSLHWNTSLLVNQVSNLPLGNGGPIIIVPAASYKIPDTSMHNTGVASSLCIGYKKVFGHLWIGAEAGIGINSFKASQTTTIYPETALQARNPLTIQRTITLGVSKMLDLKFGYTKSTHLIYGMAGIASNPVTVNSSDSYKLSFQNKMARGIAAAAGSFNYTSIMHDQKETHALMGISWGAGYQYMFSEGISIGIEYRQAGFGKGSYTTEKITGEQAINDKGENIGVAAGLEASNISVNMKQQALTIKLNIALSAIFKK